jgi:hypothetical protein
VVVVQEAGAEEKKAGVRLSHGSCRMEPVARAERAGVPGRVHHGRSSGRLYLGRL